MEQNGVLPSTQFVCRKGLGICDALFCVSIHYKVHWRVGRRLGLYRLILVWPLIGSISNEFRINSDLWVLEVLCCPY